MNLMKTICFFLHYSPTGNVPLYVIQYLQELIVYFDEVWLVSNQSSIKLNEDLNKVKLFQVKNEGYDFGKFYNCLQTINLTDYNQIACINDSNVLVTGLKQVFSWAEKQDAGFWGLIDSNEKPWFSTHINNYHIQSHFVVFNKPAIAILPDVFKSIDVDKIMKEKDPKKLRRMVINDWEIGLSQFMIENGIKGETFIRSNILQEKYDKKVKNVTFDLYAELIADGYPLLKKKVILKETSWKRLLSGRRKLHKIIKQHTLPGRDLEKAVAEIVSIS
jgi:lipopolysaccharide biosynthesis protein